VRFPVVVVSRNISSILWGGGRQSNQTGHLPYRTQGADCVLFLSVITSFSILAFPPNALSFIHSYFLNRNVFLMLKVFWLFMLQHKLAVLLPHASFINNFCQGVVIRDKVKWLRSDFTACTVSQQTVILPTVIKCALITPTGCCKLRHCNYVPFNRRKCYVQNTPSCQSVCHITSKTKPSVEFLWSSVWQFVTKGFQASVHFGKTSQ